MSQANRTVQGSDLASGGLTKLTERKVWPTIERSHFMWNRFGQMRGVEVNSRLREFSIRLYDGQVATGTTEAGLLPGTLPDKEVFAQFGFAKIIRGISFTPEAMAQMKQASSLLSQAERVEFYASAMQQEMSRFWYGEGSGAVALLTAQPTIIGAGPTYTITVDDATDEYVGVGSRGTADVKIGSDYDIAEPVTNAIRANVRVQNILSPTTFSVTVNSGTVTDGAADDILVPPGTRPSLQAGLSYMFHGIGYHVTRAAQTEWLGLNPSTTIQIRSLVKDLGGAGLTLGFFNFIADAARNRRADLAENKKTGDEDNRLLLSGVGQEAKLTQYMNSYRRAEMSDKVLTTGGTGVKNKFGNELIVDSACPDSRIYSLAESDFTMSVLETMGYVDNGSGGKFVLRPDGNGNLYHIYDGWLYMTFDFIGRNPFKQAALVDVGMEGIIKASQTAHNFD